MTRQCCGMKLRGLRVAVQRRGFATGGSTRHELLDLLNEDGDLLFEGVGHGYSLSLAAERPWRSAARFPSISEEQVRCNAGFEQVTGDSKATWEGLARPGRTGARRVIQDLGKTGPVPFSLSSPGPDRAAVAAGPAGSSSGSSRTTAFLRTREDFEPAELESGASEKTSSPLNSNPEHPGRLRAPWIRIPSPRRDLKRSRLEFRAPDETSTPIN